MDLATQLTLAKELALDTWISHTYAEFCIETAGYFPAFKSFRTAAILGGYGMRRVASLYTAILPTEGTYMVSLVNKRSETFLPSQWINRFPSSLTVNDTPLVGEIQFIDIILRPGTMILIPCHCIYSLMPTEEFNAAISVDLDSPISNLARLSKIDKL
jgi:hypothetical protein